MYLLQNTVRSFVLLQLIQAVQIYVITTEYASSNDTCEKDNLNLHPCVRLADLASKLQLYELTSISINVNFLPGEFYVFDLFRFEFHNVNFLLTSWQNQGQVKIICEGGDFSLKHSNSKTISIRNVEFYNCSNDAPIISIQNVTEVNIQYINCKNSSEGFLMVNEEAQNVNISYCIFQGTTNHFAVKIMSEVTTSVLIPNTTFAGNTFGSLMLNIYYKLDNVIEIVNCIFKHNKAGENSTGATIAVKGFEPTGFKFDVLLISHCDFINNTAGDGGAVVISDYNVNISHSKFTNNFAYNKGGAIKLDFTFKLKFNVSIKNCTFLHNTAQNGGLIFISVSRDSGRILHSIVSSVFMNNSAAENGGVLMIKTKWTYGPSTVLVENDSLDSNSAKTGGALYLSNVNSITILNCSLTNNFCNSASNISNGGAVAIIPNYRSFMSINKTLFLKNEAQTGGALWIYTSYYKLNTQIVDCKFTRNTAAKLGGSVYTTGGTIKINHTIFHANKAELGGALYLINIVVNLSSVIYTENAACAGGAIFSEKSYLHIVTVYLAYNKALPASMNSYSMRSLSRWIHNCYTEHSGKGGAIFIEDKTNDCTLNSCRLTWNNDDSINSTSNSAKLGSVLYGGMISRCDHISSTQIVSLNSSRDSYSYPPVSSASIQLCFYNTDCGVRSVQRTVHLGQSFEVHVVCLDQVMQGKDCVITSQYAKTPGVKYGVGESISAIKGQEKLVFHTYSDNQEPFGLLTISSNIMCTEEKWSSVEVNVSIRACPLGFEKTGDRCSCDHRLLEVFKTLNCYIGNISITIKDEGWFGYDSSYMRINDLCPINYCTLKKTVVMGSHPHVQCDNHRGGILCSSCVSNYSLVLGSWKCKNCSGLSSYNFIWMT